MVPEVVPREEVEVAQPDGGQPLTAKRVLRFLDLGCANGLSSSPRFGVPWCSPLRVRRAWRQRCSRRRGESKRSPPPSELKTVAGLSFLGEVLQRDTEC